MRLSPAQREVLKLVGKKGRMSTSAHTSFNNVSGTCAAALVRKGLLEYVPIHVRGQLLATTFDVEITDEGRKVAAAL
jgi:hypothetical protein